MNLIQIRTTPSKVFNLAPYQVFVFGSNTAGIHAAGAARVAKDKFGAVMRQGVGAQGSSYAIPTKDNDLCTLKPSEIKKYVDEFIEFAKNRPNMTFLITPIACGLAGLSPTVIAPLFAGVPENCVLPAPFQQVLGWPFLDDRYKFAIWQQVGEKTLELQTFETRDFQTPPDLATGLGLKEENVRQTFTMYGKTYQAVPPPVEPVVPVGIPQTPAQATIPSPPATIPPAPTAP